MTAFSFGCAFRASTVARAKNGRNESLTPSLASNAALVRSRSLAIAVTSASTTVVSCADVCSDSTMRWAMTWRARERRSVVPRWLDGAGMVFGAACAAGAAQARAWCPACRGGLVVAARPRGMGWVRGRAMVRRPAGLGVGRGSLVAGPRVWSPLIGRLLVRGLRRLLLEAGRLVGGLPSSGRGLPVAVLRLIGLSGLCGLSAGRSGRGGRGGAVLVDDGELGADLDCLVFGDRDPAEYAGDR